MQAPAPAPLEVQEALARVLARPEFQERPPAAFLVWLGRIRDDLLGVVASLFERFDLSQGGVAAVVWGLRILLIIVAALVVVWLVAALARVRPGRGGARARHIRTGDGSSAEVAVDWASAADSAAADGRFRDAVQALYQYLLDRLDADGAVRRDRSKTPGDYRRELGADSGLGRMFDEFLQLFEPVAFGGRQPDRGAFDRLSALARGASDA